MHISRARLTPSPLLGGLPCYEPDIRRSNRPEFNSSMKTRSAALAFGWQRRRSELFDAAKQVTAEPSESIRISIAPVKRARRLVGQLM